MNIAQYNKSGNNDMKISIFVQAHHENWGGGKSYCLSIVKGSPVISHVLKKLRKRFPDLNESGVQA